MKKSSIFSSKPVSEISVYLVLIAVFLSILFYIWFNAKQIVEAVYKQHLISSLTNSISNLRSYEHRYKLNNDLEQFALFKNSIEEIKIKTEKLNLSTDDQENKVMLVDILEFTNDYNQSFEQFVDSDQVVISKTIKFKGYARKLDEITRKLSKSNEDTYLVQGESIEEYWGDFLDTLDESKFIEKQLNEIDKISYDLNNQLLTTNTLNSLQNLSFTLNNIADRQTSYKDNNEILDNSNLIFNLRQQLTTILANFNIAPQTISTKQANTILNNLQNALKERKASIDKASTSLRLRYYVTQARQHRAKKITDYAFKLKIGITNVSNLKNEFILTPTAQKEILISDALSQLKLATEDINSEIQNSNNKLYFEQVLAVINNYNKDFNELVSNVNLRVEADRSMVANLIKVRAFTATIGPKMSLKIYHQQHTLSETVISSLIAFALTLTTLVFFIFIRRSNRQAS